MPGFRESIPPRAISRDNLVTTAAIGATLGASAALDMRGASRAQLHVPAGPASQVLTAYVCSTEDGTYLPLYNSAGAAVTLTAAESRAYDLPDSICSAPFLKLVAATTAFVGTFCLKG